MISKTHYADHPTIGGSIKNKIVNPDLLEERAKCNFDKEEVTKIITTDFALNYYKPWIELIKKHPELKSDEKWYCMSHEEQLRHWWEKLNIMNKLDHDGYFTNQKNNLASAH